MDEPRQMAKEDAETIMCMLEDTLGSALGNPKLGMKPGDRECLIREIAEFLDNRDYT